MTQDQTNYIASINNVFVKYADKYDQKCLLGSRQDREFSDIKLIYANAYKTIITEYFSANSAGDNNFFTVSDAENVMRQYNAITNSSYFLKLT